MAGAVGIDVNVLFRTFRRAPLSPHEENLRTILGRSVGLPDLEEVPSPSVGFEAVSQRGQLKR